MKITARKYRDKWVSISINNLGMIIQNKVTTKEEVWLMKEELKDVISELDKYLKSKKIT